MVEVVHWNPRRPLLPGRVGARVPLRRRVNNFGDLIGPALVGRMLDERRLDPESGSGRLLSVGSILHFAQPGDVVWGSGVNGKIRSLGDPRSWDVRAVRGPRTRDLLVASGATVPKVYGDPGLLWPRFWSRDQYLRGRTPSGVAVVPNLHDWRELRGDDRCVNPCAPLHEVVARIACSEMVVGSSLHGMVIADAFGIPARLVAAAQEPPFKYQDYFEGTGRAAYDASASVEEAIDAGGHRALDWDPEPLLDAFPAALWRSLERPRG